MGIREVLKNMSDLTTRLKGARSVTEDAQRQANELRREIELARRRRDAIRSAPGHRDDIKALMAAQIEARRAAFLKNLETSLKVFRFNAVAMRNPAEVRRFATFIGVPEGDVIDSGRRPVDALDFEGTFAGLFDDQLLPRLEKAIDALPWQDEGIRLAERDELLRKADDEVLGLEKQLQALIDAADEAGITLTFEQHF
jgi:hypothetical protein